MCLGCTLRSSFHLGGSGRLRQVEADRRSTAGDRFRWCRTTSHEDSTRWIALWFGFRGLVSNGFLLVDMKMHSGDNACWHDVSMYEERHFVWWKKFNFTPNLWPQELPKAFSLHHFNRWVFSQECRRHPWASLTPQNRYFSRDHVPYRPSDHFLLKVFSSRRSCYRRPPHRCRVAGACECP